MDQFAKELDKNFTYNTNSDGSPDHSEPCCEIPCIDPIHSGTSLNEPDSNDTEEEGGVLVEEDHVRHSTSFTEDDFAISSRVAAVVHPRLPFWASTFALVDVLLSHFDARGMSGRRLPLQPPLRLVQRASAHVVTAYLVLSYNRNSCGLNPALTLNSNSIGSSSAESEEESDYEEPRKMNGTPSSSVGDTEARTESDSVEEDQLALSTGDVPAEKSAECVGYQLIAIKSWFPSLIESSKVLVALGGYAVQISHLPCDRCLKCGDLINSDEKVNAACPHFHVNCFRCARCDCILTEEFLLVNGAPYCKNHSEFLSSGDTAKEENLSVMEQDDGEVSSESLSLPKEMKIRNDQALHRGSPPRSGDVLPPMGSARRLVEQWSNIEALKANQSFTNVTSAADDQQAPKSKVSTEPTEQWPSQGQARGLIAKFSAMHA
ncbi:unnamed protein product [Hydatigera taeniaeformis]|uniref:LIM zinc-binding domain-containing protein n=1 Tax=Hydatigena taeniaeformis TaxID=6205 RepID=A0A0R3X261_HYDTA|nr:unnamed protein product [Hydatigera taeniaeformis]